MNTRLAINQQVITPNGKGIYQGPLWSEGRRLEMVSHAPSEQIDPEKAQAYQYAGGIWMLCAYKPEEVTA